VQEGKNECALLGVCLRGTQAVHHPLEVNWKGVLKREEKQPRPSDSKSDQESIPTKARFGPILTRTEKKRWPGGEKTTKAAH